MGISGKTCEKMKAMFLAGYTVKEIASKFGLREGTVRTIVGVK